MLRQLFRKKKKEYFPWILTNKIDKELAFAPTKNKKKNSDGWCRLYTWLIIYVDKCPPPRPLEMLFCYLLEWARKVLSLEMVTLQFDDHNKILLIDWLMNKKKQWES